MNHFKRWIVVLLLLLVIVPLAGHISAQDELGGRYEAVDHSFAFNYPADWDLAATLSGILTVKSDDIRVDFYSPAVLQAQHLDSAYDPKGVLRLISATNLDVHPGELVGLEVGGRLAARMDFTSADGSGTYIALTFSNESLALIKATGDIETYEDVILAIAESFDVGKASAALPTVVPASGAPAASQPIEITHLNGTWQERVQEFEELGLIGSGGSLIFQEDYAYFAGQGAFFTPLAVQQPHSNIVLSGQLMYEPSGVTEERYVELCSLGLRITYEGSTATKYVDVGLVDSGNVFYDQFNRDGGASDRFIYGYGEDFFDLSVPHDFVIIAIQDEMTVFVDGKLAFDRIKVNEVEGSYAVGLEGLGPGALCEATNIWAYQIPVVEEGVCQISTASAVNKRTGPATTYDSPGQLLPGTVVYAAGQFVAPDNFRWWLLEDESWVRADVVHAEGDCANLPEVAP